MVGLGSPPFASPWPRSNVTGIAFPYVTISVNVHASPPLFHKEYDAEDDERGAGLLRSQELESTDLLSSIDEQPEMQRLLQARFLYPGGPSKDGSAVFYVIMNRIKLEHVSNINPLVSFIFSLMDEVAANPYCMVIDMSWATISPALKVDFHSIYVYTRYLYPQ